jgi:carboxymethylenebutenolidase
VCHHESPAPTVPDTAAVGERVTADDLAVPYLTCAARDGVRPVGERPWIVIATDIFGVTPFYRHLAALLAGAGYRVAVPDLFHRVGPARDAGREAALERRRLLDDRQALRDLDGVVAAVHGSGGPGPGFGVLGFCLGGTLALLSAARHPGQATVTYYAFPHAAPGAAVEAEWPVNVAAGIQGPVLGFWGRRDYISPDEVAELGAALERGAAEHEIVWYDGAGHSFMAGLTRDGTDSPAAHRSWQRTQEFFARHLASTVVS